MNIDAYITELRDRLADCPMTREQLAEHTRGALSTSWLSKFASGRMDNPRADTLRTLDAALADCAPTLRRRNDAPASPQEGVL